ncbi:MAG: type II secretion system protein GspC [Desulfuromonadaceae bacterium]|nr:type II secretion system protein GspC [Desulfuromonas sp.]MDY0184338.1 type II secretion system protein GspC [Desulfuromonadaceae bacterium]
MFAYLHRILPCYYALLSILLGLSLAWTFSSVMALYLDSSPAVTQTMTPQQRAQIRPSQPADNKIILQRNIFNSSQTHADAAVLKSAPDSNVTRGNSSPTTGQNSLLTDTELAGRPLKTADNMKLIGTIAAQGEVSAARQNAGMATLAVIEINGKTDTYRPGDLIAASSKVVKVERLRVYIENSDGSISILELESELGSGTSSATASRTARRPAVPGEGVRQINDTSWHISTERATQIRSDIGNIVRQARVEPVVEQGQTQGFVVKYIQPGTLLTQMGIMRGDVIKRVNDTSLDSPEKGLQVFQQLREAKTMSLSIERNSTPMTFSYEIR